MKKVLKYSFLGLALAVGVNTAAHASPRDPLQPHYPLEPKRAPEVDPALAISGLSLLGGTLTVLRARRRK